MKKIILIDDSASDAEFTERVLVAARLAAGILHFYDSEDAIDYLFGANEKPHLILLDLKMPKISGIDILKIIKQDPRTSIIVLFFFCSCIDSVYI
jgi:CheY-like chemotaxis protein